ncbi:hypothetical protein PMSD_23035 [Paenibacillus macquariensis subsp. defensor]|nr:hypothetical protein PMSD_23035 [Paenibacillus macquariensis subsp. defensor]
MGRNWLDRLKEFVGWIYIPLDSMHYWYDRLDVPVAPMSEPITHQYYRSAHRHNRMLPLGNRTRGDAGVTV